MGQVGKVGRMKKIFAVLMCCACLVFALSLTGWAQEGSSAGAYGQVHILPPGTMWIQGTSPSSGYAIAEAAYPQMVAYPDESEYFGSDGTFDDEGFAEAYEAWQASRNVQRNQYEGYADGLSGFYLSSTREFLSNDGSENRIYSPLNLYLALGMMSELTDGNSRAQILDLLGADSVETVRQKASALWNANFCDDGAVTSILASPLWLDEDISFHQDTLDTLAENYYASSYRGQMGSEEFTEALRSWLNEQTGGLLQEQASGLELSDDTLLALAATIYYRASWADEFSESETGTAVFHSNAGDIECDFMNQSATGDYFWGDGFSAVFKDLNESGGMWLILPDEGMSTDDLLLEGGALEQLFETGSFENSQHLMVNLSMPKFDVASDIDLTQGLKNLGVTDVFDPYSSDFSPMTDDTEGIIVSQAEHAARVTVDEEGVEAAAYTVMATTGTALIEEEVDFTLDRPFLFMLTGEDGSPLFVGVVNQPA